MAEKDQYVKEMLQEPKVFADLFNAHVFGGKQIIKPESLTPIPNERGIAVLDRDGFKRTYQRRRDLIMGTDLGLYLAVLACEIQDGIHYGMVVRTLMYDALEYTEQIEKLQKEHRECHDKLQGDEYLSGMTKDDVLVPVITLVFYYGKETWDGKTSLHELLGMEKDFEGKEALLRYIPDYRINLVHAAAEEHPERYQSDLQYVLGMLKYNQNKEKFYDYIKAHREHLNAMSKKAMMAMLSIIGEQKRVTRIMEKDKQEGEEDMCQAIDELIEDGKKEGIEKGIKALIQDNREAQKTDKEIEQKLIRYFSLSKDEAEVYLEKYNKEYFGML